MAGMKMAIAGAALALAVGLDPAEAAGISAGKGSGVAPPSVELAQHSYNSRGFRRCMRAKYGPRYFARVNRAHRWHMAQACMA
jgi:hypothetical protein